ncbi:MAG: hypothetical protein ACQKBU_10520, partial [Verrucomicrobiales bacterium]
MMPLPYRSVAFLIGAVVILTGCLLETDMAIEPDPEVDSRLAGVWQITSKLPHKLRGDRDEGNIGVHGYIILAPLVNPDGSVDESTLKGFAFDRFERDSKSKLPEMFVSTRKHKGHNLMLIRLADNERREVEEGKTIFKNWVIDYEVNERDELVLRFWSADDFDHMKKIH